MKVEDVYKPPKQEEPKAPKLGSDGDYPVYIFGFVAATICFIAAWEYQARWLAGLGILALAVMGRSLYRIMCNRPE